MDLLNGQPPWTCSIDYSHDKPLLSLIFFEHIPAFYKYGYFKADVYLHSSGFFFQYFFTATRILS